jgi:nucleoside 2-deoxyribosyltransferase
MKVYLAGGMKDGWQDKAIPLLAGHNVFDPRSWSSPDPNIYTARDLAHIAQCDVLLVHMSSSNPSGFGLSVELGFAYGIGKTIVFVDEISNDWRTNYFGMHRQMADATFTSLEAAAEWLRS